MCAGKVNRIDEAKEVMCPRGQNEERHTARYKTNLVLYRATVYKTNLVLYRANTVRAVGVADCHLSSRPLKEQNSLQQNKNPFSSSYNRSPQINLLEAISYHMLSKNIA